MINKTRLVKTLKALIRIDSQNPTGNEAQIAGWVAGYLRKLGVTVRTYEFRRNRPNVVAVMKGKSPQRSLLITPHLDTVPAGTGWHYAPFKGTVRGDRIYGLGATDCKGNLACALEAMTSLAEGKKKLDYTLVFAATADEESGSAFGLIPLLRTRILRPDAAVVLDADDFEIVVAQKGLLHISVTIEGRKAHGAYPWLGVNAIDASLAVLAEMRAFMDHRSCAGAGKSKYLHPPTMNIGTIRGGDKVNVVAGRCTFELDFRFLPGMSPGPIVAALKRIAARHGRRNRIAIDDIQKPYRIAESHPLVAGLQEAMKGCGAGGRISGSEGATVITFFQDRGIPAVATGFGCEGVAHMADEYARISKLYKGAAVLERFLAGYKFSYRKPGFGIQ